VGRSEEQIGMGTYAHDDHQLSIAVYLALNVGETLPDWVHDPKNNAIGDLLKSEEDVIKARLADLIDFDDPESEREFLS